MFSALQGSASRTSSPSTPVTSLTSAARSFAGKPSSPAGLRQAMAGSQRASALDVKGYAGGGSCARADGKVSLASAHLPSLPTPAPPDAHAIAGLLEQVRSLCTTGKAAPPEASRQLHTLVARLA